MFGWFMLFISATGIYLRWLVHLSQKYLAYAAWRFNKLVGLTLLLDISVANSTISVIVKWMFMPSTKVHVFIFNVHIVYSAINESYKYDYSGQLAMPNVPALMAMWLSFSKASAALLLLLTVSAYVTMARAYGAMSSISLSKCAIAEAIALSSLFLRCTDYKTCQIYIGWSHKSVFMSNEQSVTGY